jgi:hypothetical protein
MAQSPLLGFNNNVRHKGRVFHIQTEDSGIRHPHIITHLFADGGRILKTTKTSYAEHVGENGLSETVRAMMKEQHKAMFIALRDGQLDHLLVDLPAGERAAAAAAAAAAAKEASSAAAPPVPSPPASIEAPRPAIDPIAEVARSAPPKGGVVVVDQDPAYAATEPPPATQHERQAVTEAPEASAASEAEESDEAHNPTEPPPPPRRPTSRPRLEVNSVGLHLGASPTAPTVEMQMIVEEPSIDLDLDALERAAVEAQTPMVMRQHDLPPPPAAALGKKNQTKPVGGYSVTTSTPQQGTPRPAPVPNALPPGAGRYAPSRPAAIFANSRPQDGASIFGEDLISEKSLDEVILSYLAEDLDGPGDKK